MANVERANREFDQVANFGLGVDNQAEDLFDQDADGLLVGDVDELGPNNYVYAEDIPEVYLVQFGSTLFARRDVTAEAQYTLAEGTEDLAWAIGGQARYTRTEAYTGGGVGFGPEVVGVMGDAVHQSPLDDGVITGGVFTATKDSTGAGASVAGATSQGKLLGSAGDGDATNLFGYSGNAVINSNYTGSLGSMYGMKTALFAGNGTWTVTNAYGLYIQNSMGTGTVSTRFVGLFIEDYTRAGPTTNANLVSRGATSNNIFEGHVEIDGNLNHDGAGVGFYGTAPVAKQTGVAVDAAAIHAALVALGLIGA